MRKPSVREAPRTEGRDVERRAGPAPREPRHAMPSVRDALMQHLRSFESPADPRVRVARLAWAVAAFVFVSGLVLVRIDSAASAGLLRWAATTVLAGSVAGLCGMVAFWLYSRRSLRRQDRPHGARQWQSLREYGSAVAHQVIRGGVYTVVFAAGTLTAFQAWRTLRVEEVRAVEAHIADLAGAQRMLSQRIARQAAATPDPDDAASASSALAATLATTEREAAQLESLLASQPRTDDAGDSSLDAALDAWRECRTRLLRTGHMLVQAQRAGTPLGIAWHARLVLAQADASLTAAQQLVDVLAQVAARKHRDLIRVTLTWSVASLGLLMLLAVAVVEPTARSVRRQYARLASQATELERLALVAERTDNAVILTDADARIVWVNQAFSRITGYTAAQAAGTTPSALLDSERSDPRGLATLNAALRRGSGARVQILNRHSEGRDLWLDLDVQPLRDEAGKLVGHVSVATDITDRRRVQADLRVAAIAFNSLEAIVVTDARQIILKVNDAFTRITGYTAEEAIGKTTGGLLRSGRQDRAFYDAMWAELARNRHWQGEVWNRRKSGEIYPEWLSITAVADEDGAIVNYVAVFTDITQKKQADETIHHLAFYDALTELPNRRLLRDRLNQTIASSARHRQSAAVLFLDLDRFKELNDTKGHDVGDMLLVEVAKRLVASVRANDTVARQGGDEFVIVLDELSADPTQALVQAEHVAEKVRAALCLPFMLDGHEYACTVSIGVGMSVAGQTGAEELLRRADTAMYEAKHAGRNGVRFFDPAAQEAMEARIEFEADLHNALPDGQLRLHFQPQVGRHGDVFGAEVLLRWEHPRRGFVPPSEFIAVAEETDLIVDIGRWVLESACAQLKAWSASPRMSQLRLSVNVSARQFRQADFVEQVRAAVESSGVTPNRLKLELTESMVLLNIEDAVAKMHAIRALGVGLSMDDFGTGQSSLAYLIQLPLDQLKIDQSFVKKVDATRAGAVLVQTIIGMASNLGLDIIAEGVETQSQREFLERSGCLHYQGYLFGRPVPLAAFEAAVMAAQAEAAGA